MDFKSEIKERGLKLTWVAEVIECNYASLKVYINDTSKMPLKIEDKLKELFN